MRQVGIHLADQVGVTGDGVPEALEVRHAAATLAGAMQHPHPAGILHRQSIGHRAGAVGRLIVEHHHLGARHREDVGHQDRQVLPFVVCRDQDQRLHPLSSPFKAQRRDLF